MAAVAGGQQGEPSRTCLPGCRPAATCSCRVGSRQHGFHCPSSGGLSSGGPSCGEPSSRRLCCCSGGRRTPSRGLGDVTGAGLAPVPSDLSGARIALANWRDPWHPQAGGAERYAWEMARELAARGAVVRFVTARAAGQARGERRDGIEIVRLGGRFTVYPLVLG